jgi:alkanesulfonate monooxygenase SsuD/methylene tetrahydromethanopterin reductase-like flavin-dependent oxidoreductase (luciferase family)
METRRDVIVRAALLADELGYETFAVPEGWGLDSIPVLTEIALRSARIQLSSSILSIWGRTPATIAMTAATLHQVSGGRYVLGLGASTSALAEGFHDTPFEHPARKLRDVLIEVRSLLAGQPARLRRAAGARPLRLGLPPAPEVPIWVAALGQHTTKVAAELGDGWIPALVARDSLPSWAGQLSRLREAAAPQARALTVVAGPIAAVDEDPSAARDIAARCTAWYLAAMGASTPGRCPARVMPARSAPSSPRTRAQVPGTGPSPDKPSPSSTSSPPTEPAIRLGSSSGSGIAQPTLS